MLRPWAVALVIGVACATVRGQDAVLRIGTDLVHFGVTVTDRRGNVVQGLSQDDFQILEEGRPQTIAHFAASLDASGLDLHAGLMLDTSESMLDDIETARTAGIRFLNRVPRATDLTLVDFDEQVRVSRFSQDDFPRMVERIRTGKVEGWTALYDAFAVYLRGASEQRGRSVVVALTDGGDSRSRTRYAEVLSMARASHATIHAIGFIQNQSPTLRGELEIRLRRIAEETGGQAIFPYSMKQIDAAFDRILQEIDTQYTLGYVSSNPARDGRWRAVTVRLNRPQHKDLKVRTRKGYYAPKEIEDRRQKTEDRR